MSEIRMEPDLPPSLESLVAIWPVANNLSEHLPVGDLITLARLSVALRAFLHGFEKPDETPAIRERHLVREELHIGQHGTQYWQKLKDRATFECSSRTHTKCPSPPKPCRYCSRPICEGCIVRSSFARGHENTFQNRTRCLCRKCWDDGNSSKSERFPVASSKDSIMKRKWYDPEGSTKDYCTCTLKSDGWLCLDCKDLQNREAISSAETQCHGKDCEEVLDADHNRRRICLWCDKALPRQIGGTTRHHWNQKMVEARARNAASRQADLEEYNRKRLEMLRMSRRKMRGDAAVTDDPHADLPQFVRHLDTVNYRSHMSESAAPSGDAVYDSKRGYWRYSQEFLLKMREYCSHVPRPEKMPRREHFEDAGLHFARTNAEKYNELHIFLAMVPSMNRTLAEEWYNLKAVILELLDVKKLDSDEALAIMREDYHFEATTEQYRQIVDQWSAQHQAKVHRNKAEEEQSDGDANEISGAISSKAVRSRKTQSELDFSSRFNSGMAPHTHCEDTLGTLDLNKPDEDNSETSDLYGSDPHTMSLGDQEPDSSNMPPDKKVRQDRDSLAQHQDAHAGAFPSSQALPLLQPTEVSSDSAAPPAEELVPSITIEDVDRPQDRDEEPPPYSPNGWEWSS